MFCKYPKLTLQLSKKKFKLTSSTSSSICSRGSISWSKSWSRLFVRTWFGDGLLLSPLKAAPRNYHRIDMLIWSLTTLMTIYKSHSEQFSSSVVKTTMVVTLANHNRQTRDKLHMDLTKPKSGASGSCC